MQLPLIGVGAGHDRHPGRAEILDGGGVTIGVGVYEGRGPEIDRGCEPEPDGEQQLHAHTTIDADTSQRLVVFGEVTERAPG